ncbi:RxLR effector protein [Phytophthora megakarya]|uniref:RxLR effector protein n=1 Tax=Phytophthora megakarya TaxID=4795 RepID=A0A225WKX5_9STRA|nr:RxLR effector protein [Phytophthora megakarya]
MDRWAEAGKSDDFVKKQLKLRGLSGDALKAHKNYNYFERFEGRRDVIRLERWMTTEASTYSVWTQQGLGYINTWDDLKKAMDTDAFKLYMSYGKYFDTIAHLNMAIKPVPVIGSDASWMEKVVRILSWKHTDKPEEYVMKILGFDKFSLETLQANKHGETFLLFWLLKNERVDRLYMKELLEKLVEFEKLSPAEMTKLKNKDSLETAQENTKTLLKKLLGLNDLSKEEMVLHDKYHTYKYLSGLIKRQTIDKHISILMERLTPRY